MNTKVFPEPTPTIWAFLFVFFVLLVLSATRAYTNFAYQRDLKQYLSSTSDAKHLYKPVRIPYTIPFLGSTLSFFAPRPGAFWDGILRSLPQSVGACTLVLGGRQAHVLWSSTAVHALFRAKNVNKEELNHQILVHGMGAPSDDAVKFFDDPNGKAEKINHEYLLKSEAVNELTATFAKVLEEQLKLDEAAVDTLGEIGLYEWLRDRMFTASTNALMGSRLLEMYPNLCKDFYKFDGEFVSMFFKIPYFMIPKSYERRSKILKHLTGWINAMYEEGGGKPMDPSNDIAWEPLLGSRMNRARHNMYADVSLTIPGRAAYDLGLLFGLSSNAVPATGWMLLHILDPNGDKTLLSRVLAEVKTAVRTDGSLDIARLIALPLLQSIFQEVLRLHTDGLVTRNLETDLRLPLTDHDNSQILLTKGGFVFCPTWIAHREKAVWDGAAPAEVFYPERFLRLDESTGKQVFSIANAPGKLFAFGGGKTICPGRNFAKQEVLAALAQVLLRFDFDVIGFVNEEGKRTSTFPEPKKALTGTGVLVMGGDLKVRIRAKSACPQAGH